MRSANIGRRALQSTFSLALIIALNGCHRDLYTVGGTVSGLTSGGTLTLLDNHSDPVNVVANGAFRFTTALAGNARYAVTIGTQPTGQTCTVAGGTGTMGTANVAVVVTCIDQAYLLAGTVHGLNGPGLILANGNTTITVTSGAQTFTLPTEVPYGSVYGVTVKTQPNGIVCVVNAGSGTMPAHAVTDIVVSCIDQSFTVGGTITGLGAYSGLVLTNGTDTLNVSANATAFTMPSTVAHGAPYDVAVQGLPPAATCSVTNGSGFVAGTNVTNIVVACTVRIESVLHTFSGAPADGAEPWYGSLLLASDGNFYGVTAFGGTNDAGTVFKITPAGAETVLWSFGTGNDGSNPYGSLLQGSDGNFYGMAYVGGIYQGYVGGIYRGGTVFKITPAGIETVLWSFGNGSDGNMPYGKLALGSNGNFYGATYVGGVYGKGTIFMITPAGVETVLWSFGGGSDGAHLTGNLTLGTDGNFYGMTIDGGANNGGVVFKITPSGAETVLHSFGGVGDGYDPQGSLILGPDGNFYGMTGFGGLDGLGTIFEITPSGTETVLYAFGTGPNGPGADGESPFGDLTLGKDGAFYGMTTWGGANNKGTVFTFK